MTEKQGHKQPFQGQKRSSKDAAIDVTFSPPVPDNPKLTVVNSGETTLLGEQAANSQHFSSSHAKLQKSDQTNSASLFPDIVGQAPYIGDSTGLIKGSKVAIYRNSANKSNVITSGKESASPIGSNAKQGNEVIPNLDFSHQYATATHLEVNPILHAQIQEPSAVTGGNSRRQLSQFSHKQRFSHSQVQHHNQNGGQASRRHMPNDSHNNIAELAYSQNMQHKVYISRQTAQAQALSQSIGDASNASYVFDGGSNLVQTRGQYSSHNNNQNPSTNQVQDPVQLQVQFQKGSLNLDQGTNNTGWQQVENRSFSNESSPSALNRRNLVYRNVRNFNNLYDNRQMVSKNVEMQDTLRLGGIQNLRSVKKAADQNFLPQIQLQRNGLQSSQNYTNSQMNPTDYLSASGNVSHLKRVKRSVLEEDTAYQRFVDHRHSPISSNKMTEKPSTHHGYQSTHYTGNMAATDPMEKQNMTTTSFNRTDGQDVWKTNGGFLPDMSMSTNFVQDSQISMLKPILRRNCLHNGNNIVLQWKSFEIWPIKLEYAYGSEHPDNRLLNRKVLKPVYVPVSELPILLSMSKRQIETRVVKSLKLVQNSSTQFIYVPFDSDKKSQEQASETHSRRQSLTSPSKMTNGNNPKSPTSTPGNHHAANEFSPSYTRSNSLKTKDNNQTQAAENSLGATQTSAIDIHNLVDEQLPEEIYTSLYIQQVQSDYMIVIRPPTIEYMIPSKSFLFIKTLTRDENNEFLLNSFIEWQDLVIRTLSSYNKFTEMLNMVERGTDYHIHIARQEALKYQHPKDPHVIRLNRSEKQVLPKRTRQVSRRSVQRREKTSSPSAMQVYVLEESTGKIADYSSLNEFKMQRIITARNGNLHGCFIQNNSLGMINVKPFAVVIKGLDIDYEYRMPFQINQWNKLIGFMQLKSIKRPDNPKQLVDKISKLFLRSLHRAENRGTTQISFNAATVLKSKKQRLNQDSARKNCYTLMNKDEQINQQIQELAKQLVFEPSLASQKLTDLRNNATSDIISSQDNTQPVSPDNGNSSSKHHSHSASNNQEGGQHSVQEQDYIEQQRKRFSSDSKQALRQFLQKQKRSKILQVAAYKAQMVLLQRTDSGNVPKNKQIRYLVEIEFPFCQVQYQGNSYSKVLTEEDLVHMCSTMFCRWKNYLMTKHFRLELNIGNEKPLPRIVEDKRGEDDLISETDPREKFPITEAEKPKIEQTRAQVTNWFPV